MYRVDIKSIESSEVTHKGTFETLEEANAWIANIESKENPWSYLKERWLQEVLEGVETREVEIEDGFLAYTEYLHPKTYIVEIVDITIQHNNKQRIESLKQRGKIFAICCREIEEIIGGHNEERNLSLEQIQLMLTTFSQINEALKNNMPKTAKELISNITPDDVIVTQQMIDDINYIFNKYPL